MALNSKKILITTVSSEFFILHRNGDRTDRYFCPSCGFDVEMLTLGTAVDVSRYTTRQLVAYAESGTLHSDETARGHLLICRESLELLLQGVQ